ncbi:unnamed protein product [Discosporangium mesarthrocarpum]
MTEAGLPVSTSRVDYPALARARSLRDSCRVNLDQVHKDGRGRESFGQQTLNEEDRVGEEEEEEDDLDYFLDDLNDPELQRLEQGRLEIMKAHAFRAATLNSLGFGLHMEVDSGQVEDMVKDMVKGVCTSANVVCHFYHPDESPLGPSLDLHLESIAATNMGTRFIRCYIKPGSAVSYRLCVHKVPALACYKAGMRVAYTETISQFGTGAEVEPRAVDSWLEQSGVLQETPPNLDLQRGEGCNGINETDSTSDEEEVNGLEWAGRGSRVAYACGLEGCSKPYAHDHVSSSGLPGELHHAGMDRP